MSRRLIPFIALVALSLGLGLSGCKSPEEKACANLKELAEKIGEDDKDMTDEAKCVEQMKEMKNECKNGDDVLNCIADVSGDDEEAIGKAIMECAAKCEKK